MKSVFIITGMLLLFASSLKALSHPSLKEKNTSYWVTETGPSSNPYTVIRLYDGQGNLLSEILMNNYRLKMTPAMFKRLNRLVKAANLVDAAFIAATLRINVCRVSAIKKVSSKRISILIKSSTINNQQWNC